MILYVETFGLFNISRLRSCAVRLSLIIYSTPDADEAITESPTPEYLSDVHQFERKWHYFDDQYKTQDVLDNIDVTWMSIGTYPIGENIRNLTEQPVTPTHVGHLSGSNIGIINTGEYPWHIKVGDSYTD